MKKYINSSEVISSNFKTGHGFGDVEIAGVLAQMEEQHKTAMYNIGIGGSIASQPQISGNRLFIGACDKNFYCVDVKTGKELWRFSTQGPNLFRASIKDDIVYFTSYDQNLYALSVKDGNLVWKSEIGEKASSPKIYENKIYVSCKDNKLHCFSLDGKKIWSFKTNGPVSGSPLVYKERIYFGSWDRNIYCITTEGELVWKIPTNGQIIDQGCAKNGVIYFGSFDNNLYAVSCDGRLLWKFASNSPIDMVPYATDKRIYFISHNGTLYALSIDGKEEWKFESNAIPGVDIGIKNGVLCLASTDNKAYGLSESDGTLLWKFDTKGPAVNVSEHKNGFLISSWDCHLYHVSTKGELIWKFKTSLSYMAPVEIEDIEPPTKVFKVVWQSPIIEKEKELTVDEKVRDYDSEFKSDYTGSMNMDYLGFEKVENPLKKKKRFYQK